MEIKVIHENTLSTNNLNLNLNDINDLSILQMQLDEAERENLELFHDFTDVDMMKWFLHERRYLNQENDRSKRTIKEYQRELKMFIEQLLTYKEEIDLDIDEIIEESLFKSLQSRHLRKYQTWLATSSPYVQKHGPYSPATLERKTAIIKAFFIFLFKKGYIKEPIYEGLKIATVRKDDRPNRDLGPQDVVALLTTFESMQHDIMFTIIHVLTTTGIRNEEFCTLRVQDMKKDTIQGGYYLDVLGKGNKRRHIPLKSKVVQSIRNFRAARGLKPFEEADGKAPLFTTNTGRAFSPSYLSQYVNTQIERVSRDSSIKLTPHVFRHAFAIISKLNGVDIYDIMRSLGHEKIETTMIYLEKVFEKERHAIHAWESEGFGGYV